MIIDHILSKHGVKLTDYDVANHRKKWRKTLSDQRISEDEQTQRLFVNILEDDPGTIIKIVQDANNVSSVIFLHTTEMKQTLNKYPAVLFLDTSYKVNDRNMPLFNIMIVIGCPSHLLTLVAALFESHNEMESIVMSLALAKV